MERYPEGATAVPARFLINGASSTYEQLSFVGERKIGARSVMTREKSNRCRIGAE